MGTSRLSRMSAFLHGEVLTLGLHGTPWLNYPNFIINAPYKIFQFIVIVIDTHTLCVFIRTRHKRCGRHLHKIFISYGAEERCEIQKFDFSGFANLLYVYHVIQSSFNASVFVVAVFIVKISHRTFITSEMLIE